MIPDYIEGMQSYCAHDIFRTDYTWFISYNEKYVWVRVGMVERGVP